MAGMWTLGGLRFRELLRRTARESWEDEVFGQAARLAFYHFIAIFPGLLAVLMLLARMAGTGTAMRSVLATSFWQLLPAQAAALVTGAIVDLDANVRGRGVLVGVAAASAVWAGVNACWAMMVGLNTAYETAEDRAWWKIGRTAVGLGAAVLGLTLEALLATHYAGVAVERAVGRGTLMTLADWTAIAGILLIVLAVFYRFGPNLRRREWRWATPGATFAAVLWICATLAARQYFDHFSSYSRIYGRAAAATMLLMWLYVTNAAVLIGAEMNSEIEKAGEESGAEPPAGKGGRRR
jgi:membrane protein